jgi:hypothetical protein
MPKPNDKMNHGQLKDYIKSHELNKGKNRILMGHKKSLMVSKLKAAGHWESGKPHKKDKTPFVGKSVATKAKPTYKPKPKKKATMTKVLMNYDMDVSAKIGGKVKKIKAATKIQAATRARARRRPQRHEYTMRGWELGGGDDDSMWRGDSEEDDDEEMSYGARMPYLEGWEHDYTNVQGLEWWTKTMTEDEAEAHAYEWGEPMQAHTDLYREGEGYNADRIQLWEDPFD